MNRQYILFNLREAAEELSRIIQTIEDRQDYDYGEFSVSANHLYHHINTAWNARDESDQATAECSEADFDRWRQFPNDLDLTSL